MADCYVGEIRMFAGYYAPTDWHFCDGELLPVSGNERLYALLGPVYGGNGSTTFRLPDLRSRLPIGQGTLNGVTRTLGQTYGTETVALTTANLASHTHALVASATPATTLNPASAYLAVIPDGSNSFYFTNAGGTSTGADQPLSNAAPMLACANRGEGQAHDNIMPSFGINFIIALRGIFPTRPT